jgi:exopolysaccharide biosynthesis polyprenyl glycosylphosphotransferase
MKYYKEARNWFIRHNMLKKFLLVFNDIAILYASLFATLLFRYGADLRDQLSFHVLPFSILFIVWLFVFYIANFYEISYLKNGPTFYGTFFKTAATNAVLGIAFFYLLPFWGIAPRRNLFLFLVIFSGLDFLTRIGFNSLLSSRTFKKPTIIVGLNEQSVELAKFLKENPQLGYRLEAILDPSSSRQTLPGVEIFSRIEQLKEKVEARAIDTIIISPEAYKIPHLIKNFYQLLSKKISFYPLSGFYEKISNKILLANIDQVWFLENLSEGTKRFYEIAKRAADVGFAIAVGGVALILTPFIVLAIRLTSRGPIFFRQTRVGQLGNTFSIIKFRTMIPNAEKDSGAVWAQENDPRITKVGRFLRRSRLDELPQLWNILKGEMSFVGPRAERPEFHEELKNNVPFYEERYLIKPGLTGWAQTQYRYGASIKDAAEKLQYDLFYIKHRSLALDFSIILKTANIVFRRAGR